MAVLAVQLPIVSYAITRQTRVQSTQALILISKALQPGRVILILIRLLWIQVNQDFRLKDFSPCIGSGTNSGAPETDIVGNLRPNPLDTNPDMGAYENSLGVRNIPPFDLFGMAVGNQWTYDSNIQRKITKININIYEMEISEGGSLIRTKWYEATNDQLLLWGSGGFLFRQRSSGGLFSFVGGRAKNLFSRCSRIPRCDCQHDK